MKRQLKFRIWNKNSKKWEKNLILCIDDITSILKSWFEINQFTGLKDRTGREIYEGDIYQVDGNKIYVIVYSDGVEYNHEWYGGSFMLTGKDSGNDKIGFPFDEYAMIHGQVIGNIYENSSLL